MTKDFAPDENIGEARRQALAFCKFLSVKARLDAICSLSCSLGDAKAWLPCNTEQKAEFFFTRYSFVGKPTLISEVIFFKEILRVAITVRTRMS